MPVTPQAELWAHAPAWRWLIATASFCGFLVLLGKPWLGAGAHYDLPLAQFKPESAPKTAPPQPANSAPPGLAQPPDQTDKMADNGGAHPTDTPTGIPGNASAAGENLAPGGKGRVHWSNDSGSVSGAGLIAGYCCAGASSTVFTDTAVSSGRHYWELTLSVRADAEHPDTWTNAGIWASSSPTAHSPRAFLAPRPAGDPNSLSVIQWTQQKNYRNGDVFMFALDADRGMGYYGLNGRWLNGEPGVSDGGALGAKGSTYRPFVTISASSQKTTPEGDRWIANFGATHFKYAVPQGYSAFGSSGPVALPHGVSSARTGQVLGGSGSAASPLGKEFEDTIPVGGQSVPLPPGKWTGLAFFRAAPNSSQGDSVVLGRFEKGKLVGMVAANAQKFPAGVAPGVPVYRPCERKDYLFVDRQINDAFGEQRCWWINHATGLWDGEPIFKAAKGVAEQHGAVPNVFVNVAFRRADRQGFVTAFYLHDPGESGISSTIGAWRSSEWHRDRVAQDPRRVEYVKELKKWGRVWAQMFFLTS